MCSFSLMKLYNFIVVTILGVPLLGYPGTYLNLSQPGYDLLVQVVIRSPINLQLNQSMDWGLRENLRKRYKRHGNV